MHRFLLSSVVALLAGSAAAQVPVLPSPLEPIGAEPGSVDALRVELSRARLTELASRNALTLAGVPLPDGTTADLDLERIAIERMKFAFEVDGVPRRDLARGLELSLWKGTVRGVADSEVQISFARTGAQGWIRRGTDLVHLLPRPDVSGDWTRGDSLLVTEAALNAVGSAFDGTCAAIEVPGRAQERGTQLSRIPNTTTGGGSQSITGGPCGLRECRIAITSDFQWYQEFNNLQAQTAYTMTLLGFISDRYESQANTILTFPSVAFYTTANDPWTSQDSGGSCQDVLFELQAAWVGNVPANADLGHLLSGANLGCGVAWLDVLCSSTNNFSVAGNMNANTPFPIAVGPNNWDFMVVAHEIGHNFDALHTHDYCPPLDECAPSGYFGACQSQQVCTNQGTIMSYCHLCSGGTSNITTFFHPTSAADMTAAAASCLPLFSGIASTHPDVVAPNTPAAVSAQIGGTPTSPVQLIWRPNPATAFTAIDLASQGNGFYTGNLPGFACGDVPQFYFAFTETSCGLLTDPPGAPTNTFTVDVATLTPLFTDNFQVDFGWTATNQGATSGDWQRGVPVNDGSWDYDPTADGDGSGMCWLTQNTAGNTDVDGGAVVLDSPVLDLSAAGLTLEYEYYLNLTSQNGSDRLLVEVSTAGAGGPWTALASHTTNGGTAWRHARFDRAAFLAAGITPNATSRLRFTANDGGTASIVEAGLDGLRISNESCTAVGANYCTSLPNSSGSPAIASATGSSSIAANDLVLVATPTPPIVAGIFYFGPNAIQVPFGNGIRCVGGSSVRFGISFAVGGVLTWPVNNSVPPASLHLLPGTTWNFQAWFRDPLAGGSNFNLSNGLRIPFTP